MTPASLLEAMVKAGRLGVKSGHGFYDYVSGEEEVWIKDLNESSTNSDRTDQE